jgi:hypothetical protein
MRKLPSPALKEAECSGSFNPSILDTLTGGTVRHGTVQGHTVRFASLRRRERDTHRVKKGVFKTLTRDGGVYFGRNSRWGLSDHQVRSRMMG